MSRTLLLLTTTLFAIALSLLPGAARPLNPTEFGELEDLLSDRKVLESHSRTTQIEPWGEVILVASEDFNEPFGKLWLYLVQNGEIVYTLPRSRADESWSLFELKEVYLSELSPDYPRLIVIGDYITGVGPQGAQPFTYALLYYQEGENFRIDEEQSWQISQQGISSLADVEAALSEN